MSEAKRLEQRLRSLMNQLQQGRQAINANSRLSDQAKREDLGKLTEAVTSAVEAEVVLAWKPGGTIQTEHKTAQAKLRAAQEAADNDWNWSKLEYVSRSVPGLISRAANAQEVEAIYDQASAYLRRSMADQGEALAVQRWGSEAAGLVRRFRSDRNALRDTEETRQAAEEVEQVLNDTAEALRASQQAANLSQYSNTLSPANRALRQVNMTANTENGTGFHYVFTWQEQP